MEFILGNILVRPNKLAKTGDFTQGHTHNFDHTTIVRRGAVRVEATLHDGTVVVRDFGEGTSNPDYFLVKAEVRHKITALTDAVEYWCIYAHRMPQGDVVQHFTGWPDAYR